MGNILSVLVFAMAATSADGAFNNKWEIWIYNLWKNERTPIGSQIFLLRYETFIKELVEHYELIYFLNQVNCINNDGIWCK